MRCPHCASRDSRVTDSRSTSDGIRRRRECASCGERFTTIEGIQYSTAQVVKKDGRRESFSREKLFSGLRSACAKLKVSVGQIDEIVADIEARVLSDGRAEIPSALIGEMAMDALRGLDHVAYIRFASVYRSFTDLASLQEALDALQEGRVPTPEERSRQLPLIGDEAQEAGSELADGIVTRLRGGVKVSV